MRARSKLARRALAASAVALAAACAGRSHEPTRRSSGTEHAAAAAGAGGPGSSRPEPEPPSAAAPTLLITDPDTLAALEARGLSLSMLFGAANDAGDNAAWSRLAGMAPLVQVLEQEIRRAAAEDPLAGVDVARHSHRLFDARFLRSATARFALAGVVNRPDRAAFAQRSCGETRLVYRLTYAHDAERASKLPMTLGVELQVPRSGADCREAAARWLEPAAASAEARAAWLRSEAGPLSSELTRASGAGARVVVNLQLVRWPSTVRPDLGGHADYLLRAFRPDADGRLRPEPLENTIDPAAFRDPRRAERLLAWLEQNAAGVDAGTGLLPAELLATRTLSVTPRGLARLANRPFSAALRPGAVPPGAFADGKLVKSPLGLLRRLDQLSCSGCHEARSVAGFHLLGEDPSSAPDENALALPVSPQVLEDLPRRLRVARQMLAGQEPDFTAPFAERASEGPGGYGAHCDLGRDPTFRGWSCAEGLTCSAIEASAADPVGQCLPDERQVGDACEIGYVAPERNRRRDRMSGVRVEICPDMVCNRSGVGFPAGMCTAGCGSPGAVCGSIAILDSFNACLARGDSFLACIRGNVKPAGLRGCDADNPCRDDYVCARSPAGGVCLPPYFVFQLRVDGHSSASR